jgi:hypothetical protein
MMRVTVSTPPPAGRQTMILIGRVGKSCADAGDAANSAAAVVRRVKNLSML